MVIVLPTWMKSWRFATLPAITGSKAARAAPGALALMVKTRSGSALPVIFMAGARGARIEKVA